MKSRIAHRGRGSDRTSEQPLLSPSNFLKNKKTLIQKGDLDAR
nr:MAG TPA: hypothetical protein [Bacteriophage sp.]